MAQKQIYVEGLGPATLSKRRGNSYLRLSVRPSGQIYLSMPYWTPFISGERFIKSKQDWLLEQLDKNSPARLQTGDQIGKNHRLRFTSGSKLSTRVTTTEIIVSTPRPYDSPGSQSAAKAASERALRKQSEKLLPIRLEQISREYGLTFKDSKIRKLTSRWGSCSSKGTITLSIYLVQLPWELIDYVLIHELVHVKHMNHGKRFWQLFERILPTAKERRKQIRRHRPAIEPISTAVVA